MLYTLTIILITIIAVLMVIVVLLQSGQGQGLSGGIAGGGGGIGGGGSANTMGARRTADFLSKATSILATLFLTLCVLANFFIDREQVDQSTIQQQAPAAQTEDFGAPAETAPALPEQQEEAPAPVEEE